MAGGYDKWWGYCASRPCLAQLKVGSHAAKKITTATVSHGSPACEKKKKLDSCHYLFHSAFRGKTHLKKSLFLMERREETHHQ